MTVRCPYCLADAAVERGRLANHPAMKGKTTPCIGTGEPVEAVREINEQHRGTRERAARVTGRR